MNNKPNDSNLLNNTNATVMNTITNLSNNVPDPQDVEKENVPPAYCQYNSKQKNTDNVQECIGSTEEEPTPQVVPIIVAPIVLTPAMLPIGRWLGQQLGKWILGQATKKLKELLFPSSNALESALNKLREDLERKFDERLNQDTLNRLQGIYIGLLNLSSEFVAATENLAISEKKWFESPNPATEMDLENKRSLVRDKFINLHDLIIARIPEFLIPNYEEIGLPIYAQVATLDLIHLKDGVLKGESWGLSADEIRFYKGRFNYYLNNYTNEAHRVFNVGFNRLKNKTNHGIGYALNYRTAMNIYLFDVVYQWSFLRYEGITPKVSRSLYHYIGQFNNSLNNRVNMDGLMKIIECIPNKRVSQLNVYYYMKMSGSVPWPIKAILTYNKAQDGDPSAQTVGWLETSGSKNVTKAVVIPNHTTARVNGHVKYPGAERWNLTIQEQRVIANDYIGNDMKFDLQYPDHFLRNISYIPGEMPSNPFYSLGHQIKYSSPNGGNNIVVGFSPPETKSFFVDRVHLIKNQNPENHTTIIPAIHYNRLSHPNQSFFDGELGNGANGSLILAETGNTAYYDIISYSTNRLNRKIIIRVKAGSGDFELRVNGTKYPVVMIGGVPDNYYDYITAQAFTIESNKKIELTVSKTALGSSNELKYNQLLLVDPDKFSKIIDRWN
ncbi:insecticidal delta-endotoxin Cry8Ea1 family protein [Bacillus thuringiensis]|uniref:Crystaline entomocidal protoxin n=1 Tax=Bacillus thuringiensis serovar toumanoffi TaxID=180862 RepID=A0ABD5HRH5_BACTU|nr:insecticidal delta-endotoxin Cry8Ea1 family protein [Bacillus thuringiensis]MCR6784119.1 insecticidal delta-endotoxin Cry8Ea1 family protein [Bacillus thuringiensis]MCR6862997.1 insecticidal delta-endotoxin Cry8Ea1 family protein [Bacillus thuringiensis]MCR6868465.1 insecticidal delta-endotoxin Cry8Ea1 family protein [Bacillus thuringiensis]MDW9207482.1 Crystaline entomocidal protoxin [Bacillus thuringiensis serovar toumanoffi]MED2623197.1 insecticidal delta-endotoxin Cry8Ea1 family protein